MTRESEQSVFLAGAAEGRSSLLDAFRAQDCRVEVAPLASPGASGRNGNTSPLLHELTASVAEDLVARSRGRLGPIDQFVLSLPLDLAMAEKSGSGGPAASAVIDALTSKAFLLTQRVLRVMGADGGGNITFLCPDSAVDGKLTNHRLAAACCSLLALASCLAGPAFRYGININALVVGRPFAAEDLQGRENPAAACSSGAMPYATSGEKRLQRERRLSEALDQGAGWDRSVCELIAFLASPQGRLVAGSVLNLSNIGRDLPLLRWT